MYIINKTLRVKEDITYINTALFATEVATLVATKLGESETVNKRLRKSTYFINSIFIVLSYYCKCCTLNAGS
jgi:hypothetical protein